ncbi:MAG TPA: hypothetical protein VH371_06835 [Candidatus Limnocylindrales bacterium]
MPRVRLGLVFALLAAGCTASPANPSGLPPVLEFENRGGPAFSIRIGDTDIGTVACDSGASVTPGQGVAPPLPWDLKIIRVRDGTSILVTHVTQLPRYFIQIGSDPATSLSAVPAAGPPGPTCPPGG